MAEACRALWRVQFLHMLGVEAGVRFSADPEYVHQMRVATGVPGPRRSSTAVFAGRPCGAM